MGPDELLEMTPALLAKSILHRRERLAETIPEQLDARKDELRAAEPLARSAKEQRDSVNDKVANLKKERNTAREKAKTLFQQANDIRNTIALEGGVKQANPEWAQNKLNEKLKSLENELETNAGNHKTEQKYLAQMKTLLQEHEQWVGKRKDNTAEHSKMKKTYSDARKQLELAEKAHQALLEQASENEFFHNTYLEQEAHRRRADGRTKRLAVALDRSQKGIEFWQNYIDNGFDKLMENAKRVQSGERSSFIRHKEAKKENQSRNTKKNRSQKPNQAGEEE
tara:strand:+ start:69 stop:914 length:846 start_codon:yes stop_codon:yes gene_type:complete